jgi:CelD/BcsL family acetyltransferase involved in cellulose biosynthesis
MRREARIIAAHRLPAAERKLWERLCLEASGHRTPFLSPAFTECVAAVRPYVYVAVIEEHGTPAAFFPFQYRTAMHRMLRIAEPVGGDMSDYSGLVAREGFQIASRELIRLCRLAYILIVHLEESQLAYGLQAARSERGHLIRMEEGGEAFWDNARRRDKKFVAELQRRERQLIAQYGPLRFCLAEKDWRGPLDHIIRQKSEQYIRTGKADLLAAAWRRNLLTKLAGCNEPTCTGIVSTLYAGSTWVASQVGLRHSDRLSYYFPVYNTGIHRFSPGSLLLKQIIDHSAGAGLTLIDRCSGDTQAKRDFSTDTHLLYRDAWFRPGARTALYRAGMSLKWRLQTRHSERASGLTEEPSRA